MEGVEVWPKGCTGGIIVKDGDDVVDVPPEPEGIGRDIRADSVFPEKCHEDVGVGGGKGTAHGRAIDLVIKGVEELETIVF